MPWTIMANDKISSRLQQMMKSIDDGEPVKTWIYFKDKDTSPAGFQKAATGITPRAMQRRADLPLDWYDLPVKEEYIIQVTGTGGKNVRASRWLNAVSARLTAIQIEQLAAQEYVERIDLVFYSVRSPQPKQPLPEPMPVLDSTDYGRSFIQNHMLAIDSLHNLGLDGSGVLIAFFDTGFLTTHSVLDSMTILYTWNFIDSIPDVANPVSNQTEHGTATLSACGGYAPGQLIGPAYGGEYILARTEIVEHEIRIEEDNWVLAAEWAESLGADIISSSLGYSDWYTYADMDGNTAATTIAADIAASRGVLVVVSAGNESREEWHYILAPADADSVIAVGALNLNQVITDYSSYGPSYDGRVKPDLVAMGSGVWCASDVGGYFFKSGTSLSAPLISGAAALVLQAIPSLRGKPMELRRRLIESADRYAQPDYRYGYGLPDPIAAAGFDLRILPIPMIDVRIGKDTLISFSTLFPPGETVFFDPVNLPDDAIFTDFGDGTASLQYEGVVTQAGPRQFSLAASAGEFGDTLIFTINTIISSEVVTVGPNPCTDSLRIFINEYFPDGYKIEIYSLTGDLVYRTFRKESVITWPGTNQHGEKVASGVYIIRFSADGIERKVKIFKM